MGAKSYYFEDNQIKPIGDIPEEPSSSGLFEKIQNDLLKDITILVVDDNPINLTVAHKTLAKFGAKTVKALSGAEGIKVFKKQTINLVLMDLHMPFMDGFETAQKLKATQEFQDRPAPILAYTTYAFEDVKDQIESAGLDGYIGKPFTQYQVLERIIEAVKPQ
jgi:two-component system cell cycle response regulator DivK